MLKTVTQKRDVFAVPPNRRAEILGPLEYGMQYGGRVMEAPNVPLMVRSSLGQRVLVHRFQMSRYISRLRNYGMRPDHPAFKGHMVVNTAPRIVVPTRARLPLSKKPGTMAATPRFPKALGNPPNNYQPPEY